MLTTIVTVITLMAFFVNSPVVLEHKSELRYFKVSGNDNIFRTGETVTFNWSLMGTPQKLILIFGDGNVQEVTEECFKDNGALYGSLEHQYAFQGKYTPILRAYYYKKTFSENFDLFVQNDAPLFSFGFNTEKGLKSEGNLRISSSPFQAFEDEPVNITVSVSNDISEEGLTYQYNFGESQTSSNNNSAFYAWANQGEYPVIVTVIGSQGELSQQTQNIEILNRPPTASFKVINGNKFKVGEEIKFTAEDSTDTSSDKNTLRYVWEWGDGHMDYGKIISHIYTESGEYNVTLFVKDDDSFIDQVSQVIKIINTRPEITLGYERANSSLEIYEGEEFRFSAFGQDDDVDVFKLLYYWNFDSAEFDPSDRHSFNEGGWKNKHIFEDDYEGKVSVAVIDSAEEFDSDYVDVRVLNVAPEISVVDARIVANISFQAVRNDTTKEANFTFSLYKGSDQFVSNLLQISFYNSDLNTASSEIITVPFTLSDDWKVLINATEPLPDNSLFQTSVNLKFIDGQELILDSGQLTGGNYGSWEYNISSEFFDEQNYSYMYPISIDAQLFDPSIDDVECSVIYEESKILEITSSDLLPTYDRFTFLGVDYVVEILESDSKQFANITATKLVFSKFFENHSFPLSEELSIVISSITDILDILQDRLGLSNLIILDCVSARNFLKINAIDDDLGKNSLSYSFDTTNAIELNNFTTRIDTQVHTAFEATPYGKIGGFPSSAFEGDRVKFTSKTNSEDINGMLFMWSFGDGTFSYSEHAKHAWVEAGDYEIMLSLADPYGNIHIDRVNITILPKAPEIVGPLIFQGTEGSTITLDVEVYDSTKDEANLKFFWYDEQGLLVSRNPKPVLHLDDGTYVYKLVVTDTSGLSATANVTTTIHSLSPEIFMSNYMYHGIEGDFRFNNVGELELRAFALDTLFDSEKLYFYWTIRNGKEILRIQDCRYQVHSIVTFTCKETTTYAGEVRVVDPEGNEKVATFQIISSIDSSLDGINDETEEMLRLSDEPSDTDGDGLTDTYEMTVSNTSYLDPDTDGDLLWDGQTVNGNIGEQAVSTDPLDWDSDDDFLSDGTEYLGWNITVVYFENTMNFHITSESLDNDTDNDGLTDYAEYYAGSNPRQADTDNDDLTDDIDPFPSKWDGDEDLLSDYEEIMRGTDWNNTDSDQDGLTDGAEVYGWGGLFFTNPLDADSDHDHISDSAEIKNYLVKLQDEGFDDLDTKLNLSTPISLNFPHHFEQAVAAQISFGISFGEYGTNATANYGVEDQDVMDLSVILTKKDDGVVLANFTTNNTRYFSQVVDITSIMNNVSLGLDYYGDYEIGVGYKLDGNYRGTYFGPNFEFPEDNWFDGSSTGCSAYERSSPLDGHTDVLVLEDQGDGSAYAYYDGDTARGHGTVQFCYRITGHLSTDGASRVFYSRRDSYPYGAITLWLDNGKWYCKDGSTNKIVPNIPDPVLDSWYDIKIDWCRDGTSWEGLSDRKFQITINGTSSGSLTYYNSNNYDPTWFRMYTSSTHTQDFAMYYDALSFSWDDGYDEEKCLDLVPYEYVSTFDTGLYAGNYRGTYFGPDFEFPEDNWYDGSSTGCSAYERSHSLDGHTDVLVLEDQGDGSAYAYFDDDTARGHGTVQFCFRITDHLSTDGASRVFYSRRDSYPYGAITLWLDNGKWYCRDGSTDKIVPNIPDPVLDSWYDIKIDWCRDGTSWEGLANKKFQITINETSSGPLTYYNSNNYDPTWFRMYTSGTHTQDFAMYYDALSFSWDQGYDEDECLELSSTMQYNTEDLGCYLDYFELDFSRYLDPNDPDTDDDGILDGVEMGVLVAGNDTLDFEDYYYYNNLTLNLIGNFSATYSFGEESVGTTNTDIAFIDSVIADSSCLANITSEFEYHNKVLELSDDNGAGKIYAYNTAFDRQNGTIEFWWAQTYNTKESFVNLYDDGTGTALSLYMRSTGQYSWYDGSWHDVLSYSGNAWYHHKITFNCSEGTNGRFSWYINGELEAESIEFEDDCDSLDKLLLGTSTSSTNFDAYFDAIGFTWNWSYWEGENYENQLPEGLGSGHYYGTYSFENEEDGTSGTNIDFVDANSFATCEIVADMDGHNKVLKLTNGAGWGGITDNILDQTSGTVEWWVRLPIGYASHRLLIYDGATIGVDIYFHSDGKIYEHDGSAADFTTYTANTWTHVRIDFECGDGNYTGLSPNTYYAYVDEEKFGPFNFMNSVSALDKVYFDSGYHSSTRYMDAVGYSWDSSYEIGDNLLSSATDLDNTDEFYLEIPQIGVVYDSQLYLEVESNGTPEGSGKVFVQLVKEQLNCSNNDISLFDYCLTFDSTHPFSYEKSLDLTPYISTNEVYGTYKLRVQTFSTASTDIFNVTRFEIESDTYITAEFGDYDGIVTDPAESDTDGDGLSDYYEIFTGGTNPNSVDTDGDEAWDDADRDPLKDIMIEFTPISGKIYDSQYTHLRNPLLQIVINCSFVSPDYSIITPCVLATGDSAGGYNREAYFSDYRYYANIDDDADEDGEVIIPLQLWLIERHLGLSDLLLIGDNWYPLDMENMWFDLSNPNTQELYFYASAGGGEWVYVNCTLVGIEKANTIAIYDVNSTFTGRYHDREQGYSVIQLQIPDEGHYWGSESFLEEQIGANSTNIAFVDEDDSDLESMVKIIGEVGDHTNILCLQEGLDDHADITHDFSSQTYGTIEWWWRTSDINGGNSYFYLRNGETDVIRLFMRDDKIKYHNGTYNDIMAASSNTWYRMKLVFCTKIGVEEIYRFDLYVDGVLKQSEGTFYNNQDYINNLRIMTTGDPFNSYFDAFGYSWDNGYDLGDNSQTYSVEGTPFEHGMNVIVIPTELFTHTLLNGYVENDELDQTPLYHPGKNMFEFSGIERDGQPTQANADADLMFYRRSISPSDAQDVLDLVLMGLLNETWDEEDAIFLHSYISTKLNDTKATVMNLPYSVLGFIPWFNSYSNSMMGSVPGGGENIWLWLDCLFNPILAETLHSQMAMSGGEFFKYLSGYVSNILMSVMTLLGDLTWLIARAALLVLFYILLAIELVIISVETLVMGASFLIIGLFLGIDVEFGINWAIAYGVDICAGFIEITQSSLELKMETWITWLYWDYFDIYMPWITYNMVQNEVVIQSSQSSIIDGKTKEDYQDAPFVPVVNDVLPTLLNNTCEDLGDDTIKFEVDYFDKNAEGPSSTYGIKVHIIPPSGTALSGVQLDSVESSPDFTTGDFISYEYSLDTSTYDEGLWQYYFTTEDGSTDDLVRFPNEGYFVGINTADSPKLLFSPHLESASNDFDPEGWKNDNFTSSIFWWDPVDENEPDEVNLCLIPAQPSIGGTGSSKTAGIQKFEMDQVESNPDFEDPVEYSCTLNFASLGYQDSEIGEFYHYYEAILTSGEVITYVAFDEGSEHNLYGPYVKSTSSMNYNLEIYSTTPLGSESKVLSAYDELSYILEVSDDSVLDINESPLLTYSHGEDDFEYEMELVSLSSNGKDAIYIATVAGKDLNSGLYDLEISTPSSWDSLPSYEADKLQAVSVYNFFNSMILKLGDSISTFGNIFITSLAGISVFAILDRPDYLIASGMGIMALFGFLTAIELESLEASEDTGGLFGLSIGCLLMFLALDTMFGAAYSLEFANDLANSLLGYMKFALALSSLTNIISITLNSFFPKNEAGAQIFDFFDSIMYIFPQLLYFIGAINTINLLVKMAEFKGSTSTNTYKSFIVWYKRFLLMLGIFSMISFITSLFGGYDEFSEFTPF